MKKRHVVILVMMLVCLFTAIPAQAKWVANGNGGYDYYTSSGKKQDTIWVATKNLGIVTTSSGKTYAIKKEGGYYHGTVRANGKYYYFDKKGKIVINKWIKGSSGRRFHTDKQGAFLVSRMAKIGKNTYYFNSKGVMVTGVKNYGGKTYYFDKNGKMLVKKLVRIKGKIYWFNSKGEMVKSTEVGRYYFTSKGYAATNKWRGNRYYGANGKYAIGLTTIGTDIYYFDSKGNKVTNTTKNVDGRNYTFDKDGKALGASGNYESTFYTDPVVSDEVLLSAILYCEAGNQPYYGQLAVALVITNRMRSSQFPNSIKEVIYAKQQFEPARNGTLTNALKNQSVITENCKKAAKVAIDAIPKNKYNTKNDKGETISLKDYYFFMTPAAYARLGLSSSYIQIGDHVFFKTWSR